MKNLCMRVGMSLLFVACGLLSGELCFWGRAQAGGSEAQNRLTSKEADIMEEGLKTNPDNLTSREALIRFYFVASIESENPGLREKREPHIFWLIEHHPESELAGSPEAGIMPMGFSEDTEAYQRGKELWLQQVEKHPGNVRIVRHAAQFVWLFDRKLGRELLEKASLLDPTDAHTTAMLAQWYENARIMARSSKEREALSEKALSIRERGLYGSNSKERFYGLDDLALDALEAGDAEKAARYASELLQIASQFKDNWNYGNAVHKGNIVLGRVALRRGDVPGARQHLLAAGETPGSPQLDSFGPNMTLAKELLEKGEREAVLAYLQSCTKFWKMGGDRLQGWIAMLKGGGTPDFTQNLDY